MNFDRQNEKEKQEKSKVKVQRIEFHEWKLKTES